VLKSRNVGIFHLPKLAFVDMTELGKSHLLTFSIFLTQSTYWYTVTFS
jgi:hypothetical protein